MGIPLLFLFLLTKRNKKYGIPIFILLAIEIYTPFLLDDESYFGKLFYDNLLLFVSGLSVLGFGLYVLRYLSINSRSIYDHFKVLIFFSFHLGLLLFQTELKGLAIPIFFISSAVAATVLVYDRLNYYDMFSKKSFLLILVIQSVISIGFLLFAFDQKTVADEQIELSIHEAMRAQKAKEINLLKLVKFENTIDSLNMVINKLEAQLESKPQK